MRTVKEWRLLAYEKMPCYENMAIDECMIKFYEKTRRPILRLYGWSPAAISIGKHQNPLSDINIEACTDDDMAIVRRITGGGAILHDDELTYSLVCSEDDINCKNQPVKASFEKLNSFIMNFYREMGLKPAYAKDAAKKARLGAVSAFCFSGSEEYDIMVKGKKIGGNAQCRKKDVIFQHGSIPFSSSEERAAKYFNLRIDFGNFTTLKDAIKKKTDPAEAAKRLESAFKRTFKFRLKEEKLTDKEKELVDKFVIEKYSSDEWNIKGDSNNGRRDC
ncbi:MAG TPA: lipoate--protein ligase family protein [Candidatus Goldiibacteriota bacterium]|nr:lipoate--protein ligase family protein [Candidatus Goldiibacteriota bacterium]